MQEEAKLALQKAADDQKQALLIKRDAAALVRASESKRKDELTRIQRDMEHAIRTERSLADSAVAELAERHERRMSEERLSHEERLRDKEKALEEERANMARTRARIRLMILAVILLMIFLVAGLAGLLSAVWQYFVGVAVIVGFFGVVDQFVNR